LSLRCLPITATFVTALSAAFAVPPQGALYMPTLTYDVASVRECPPGPQNNGFNNPLHSGQLIGTCDWVEQLIAWAYGVDSRVQVVGGPNWVKMARSNEVRFEVQATSNSATDDKLARLSDDKAKLEKEHMLQALLEDRFGLRAHLETRQEPALNLTAAKHGPRLQKGEPMGPKPEYVREGTWFAPIGSHRDPRGIAIVAHGASMQGLAGMLQFQLRERVFDRTGISGTYNFTLQFHGALSDIGTDNGSMWPPIEIAIKEQLGLRLKATRAPVQVVVIDHIEMPSPN
jgi:uncharacterized protein (TIGR03435 family)